MCLSERMCKVDLIVPTPGLHYVPPCDGPETALCKVYFCTLALRCGNSSRATLNMLACLKYDLDVLWEEFLYFSFIFKLFFRECGPCVLNTRKLFSSARTRLFKLLPRLFKLLPRPQKGCHILSLICVI